MAIHQITVVQADATDEDAIRALCERAVDENGRIDVYFANVRRPKLSSSLLVCSYLDQAGGTFNGFRTSFKALSGEAFMKTVRLNTLSYVSQVHLPFVSANQISSSCFLAAKYASEAMSKISPANGKFAAGGSIIFTASGMVSTLQL